MKIEWDKIDINAIELFECQLCGAFIAIDISQYDEKNIRPFECLEYQGGCGRKAKFFKLKHESRFYQIISSKQKEYEELKK